MQTSIKATQFKLTPANNEYIQEKLVRTVERLTTFTDTKGVRAAIEVEKTTRHHQKGQVWRAEAMVSIAGKILRCEEFGQSFQEAVDILEPRLAQEIKRWKGKTQDLEKRGARKVKRKLNTSKAARFPRKK